MSLEKAEEYLKNKGMLDHVIRLEDSTATVVEAAQALGVEPGMIAKTMSFLQDDQPVLILTEGTARIDNRKYKDRKLHLHLMRACGSLTLFIRQQEMITVP